MRALGLFVDTIVMCSVTGNTRAGSVAGFHAIKQARARRVLGVDASAKPEQTRAQITRTAAATAELIGVQQPIRGSALEPDDRDHGGVYGIPDGVTLDAMHITARTKGMITDPMYEGKSLTATIDLVSRHEITSDSTVLYAYLGRQPAINEYSRILSW